MAPLVCFTDHMRTARMTLLLLLLAALAVPGAASAAPQGSSLPATAALAKTGLAAKLEACTTADAARSAIFKGSMPAVAAGGRMEMRFELYQRPLTRLRWTHVQNVDSFDEWDISDPGISGFIVKKRVGGLLPGSTYRAVVRYRWRTAAGKVVRRVVRITPACAQPDTRPDLVVRNPSATGGRRGGDLVTYSAVVVNKGNGPSGQFNVVFELNGVAQPAQRFGPIAVGQKIPVSFQGPRCTAGSLLKVTVDSSAEVAETNEANNTLSAGCTVGG